MGVGMARAAIRLHNLDELALRVLVAMAVEVRDTDRYGERGVYYAGVWRVTVCVGLFPTNANRVRIMRAIRTLVDAGVLVRHRRSAPGRNAEYRVVLEPLAADGKPVRPPVDNPEERVHRSRSPDEHDTG
jgi:hypothetical protein